MIRKATPVIAVLLLLVAAILSPRQAERSVSDANDDSATETTHATGENPPGAETRLKRPEQISPPSWKPAEVFARIGKPEPQYLFPRGESATRRYHATVSREIDPELSRQKPSILAKLPEDGRFNLLPGEIDEHTLAAGRLVFDPSSLDRVVNGEVSRVLAPTLGDEVLTLEFRAVKTRSATTHTLQGHVLGEEATSIAQIVYHDGILHGTVMRYGSRQEIEYRIMEDGHMMVRELDHSSMNDNCPVCQGFMADMEQEDFPEPEQTEPSDDGGVIANATPGWRTIDVVVGYSQEARILDGGFSQIEARIIGEVDRMTLAFANSQIADTEIMLLGTIEDPAYVAPGSSSSNLGDELINLRNEGDGVLDTVTDLGTRLGADLVSFVTPAGQGGQGGVANGGNRYTINSRTSMTAGQMVFAHELGHNMGAGHAWGDSSKPTGSNTGWRLKTQSGAQVTTINAYSDGWGARIPYYSNPNVLYDGARTGAVDGYDATGDPTADPRLVVGGLRYGPSDFGFDGNTPTLGANNAGIIDLGVSGTNNGATVASNWAARTAFEVISPAAAAQWERGTIQTIRFNGGDMEDLATIKLYKGGVLHSTLASGINPATIRNFEWAVPFELTDGPDYMIRVELETDGGTLIADSGIFTVFSDPPYVISSSAPAVPPVVGQISQVVLTFNVPMDTATFSAGNDIVSFSDPVGNPVISSITGTSWSAGNTVLTINFTPPTQPGTYQLIIGPDIADTVGSLMDQDGDGATGESVEDRHITQFTVNPPLIYQANMDSDPGWTLSANNPATNGWAYGQPTGQGANPFRNNDPASGFTGPNVIGYNLDGDYQTNIPDTRWATTPAFDCSGLEGVTLSFQRWIGVSSNDDAYIQVSNNGTSWTTVWEHPANVNTEDNAWVSVEYDISAVADGQAAVHVRWGLGRTFSNANGGASGWNIDDVVVYGTTPDNLAVTPAGILTAIGVSGGPFSPASFEYTLQNTGTNVIQWTAGKTANWVSLSASSGTLAAGASTTVTVSINSEADLYGVGDYGDVVTFTNETAGIVSATRSVDLEVLGPGTLEVGPAGDFVSSGVYGSSFSPDSFEYTLTNGGVTPIDWSAVKAQAWVTVSPASGSLAPGASTTVTVSINENADALDSGNHADTVSFFNLTNESGDTARAVSLTVYPLPANLYWDANGNNAGAGGTPTGTWGTSNFWNTNSTGGAGTFSASTFITSNLFFVAGPASNSGATITVSGAQAANSITFQHPGNFTITGGSSNPLGSIALGNGTAGQGGITLNEFAFGGTAQGKLSVSAPVSLNNPQTWTNNRVDADFRQQSAGLDFTAASGGAANGLTLSHALAIDGKGVTSLSGNTATTISGTGGITKNGTGTLILSTANADNSGWSGGLTVNGGLVRFQYGINLGTGNINLAGGVLEGNNAIHSNLTRSLGTGANQIRITGGVSGFSGRSSTASVFTITGAGTNPLVWGSANFSPSEFVMQASTANTNGAATFTNGINLNSGTRTIRSDQTGGLAGGGVATLSGAITGTGNLIKTGPGHVFLTGSSNYSGTTTVSEGTLTLEDIGAAPGRNTPGMIIVAAGATLGVQNGSWAPSSIDSLRNNVTWSDTGSELGFIPGATSVTYPSDITQTLSIHKYGTNTLVLTGTSTYPGTTTISKGTLQLGDGNTGKDGTIEGSSGIINNAALVFNRFGNLSSGVAISGSGSVTKSGAGTQTLTGNNSYSGTTTVSAGKLFINGNQTTATGNVSVAAKATLGGTGTIGGNTTIAAGGKLEFNLSTAAGSHNPLDLIAGKALSFSGASELIITSGGGADPGTYTLLTGGNNISGIAPATLNLPIGWTATVSISGNSLLLNVTSTGGPGPVDQFVISSISSPQTVGTAITGITITAQDVSNNTATSFTGTVTFGGTAGITGTSAAFANGVLSGVSVTPFNAGSPVTLTVSDGTGHTGSISFTVRTIYEAWAAQTFANPFLVNLSTGNPDGDSLNNLQEFAFGMDPTKPDFSTVTYVDGGDVTKAGVPVIRNFAPAGQAADWRAVFARRKDHAAAGLTYTAVFSADLNLWTTNAATPTRLTGASSAGAIEAVSIPFPATVPLQSGGSAAPKFFRIGTTGN